MNEHNGSNGQTHSRANDILVSLSVGVLAGVAGALLLAPASGRDTRSRINRAAHRIADKAGRLVHRTGDTLKGEAARVEHAIHAGAAAYRETPGDPNI
jgi:gas vesicle protein